MSTAGTKDTKVTLPPVVSPDDWEAVRQELLVMEKAHMRAGDALAAERRKMPMTAIDQDYVFEGPEGKVGLADLFDGRRQLVMYRFFMDPGMKQYPERGCPGCSFMMDQLANLAHVRARDTNFVTVSAGEQEHLQRYKEHMGWDFPWYTTTDGFSADHGVDEWHGTNVFIREGEDVYRTYWVHDRGDEAIGSTWSHLDLTPFGRQEEWEDSPEGVPQTEPYTWWNYHDRYEEES